MEKNNLDYVSWTPSVMSVFSHIEMVWAFIKKDVKRCFLIHPDAPMLLRHMRDAFDGRPSIDSLSHHDGVIPCLYSHFIALIETKCNKYIEDDPEHLKAPWMISVYPSLPSNSSMPKRSIRTQ